MRVGLEDIRLNLILMCIHAWDCATRVARRTVPRMNAHEYGNYLCLSENLLLIIERFLTGR